MDSSAFEALKIGTYVFVFMIAVTAAFTLMGTVNDMVEYTKTDVVSSSNNNLVEDFGGNIDRTFTGAEILSIYGQKLQDKLPDDLEIYVDTGTRQELTDFVNNYINVNYNKTFELIYEEGNKWVFVEPQTER